MHFYKFVLLFLLFTLPACQQGEKALLPEANLVVQAGFPDPMSPAADPAPATNLVLKSANDGLTWLDISAGLPKDLAIQRVYASGNDIYLCSANTLYHSSTASTAERWENDAFFWGVDVSDVFPGRAGQYVSVYREGFYQRVPGTSVLVPLHDALKDRTVRAVMDTPDGALFVGCESGLYKSTDTGKSWKQVIAEEGVNSLTAADGVLICGMYGGLLRSTDGGEHWDKVLTEDGSAFKTSYANGRFLSITQGAKSWRDGAPNRLRMSVDGGKTWQRIDEGLAVARFLSFKNDGFAPIRSIYDIEQTAQYLYCSCDAGIFRSSDWGKNWESVYTGNGKTALELAVSRGVIYVVPVTGC